MAKVGCVLFVLEYQLECFFVVAVVVETLICMAIHAMYALCMHERTMY